MFGPSQDLALLSEVDLDEVLQDPESRRDLLAWYYFATKCIHTLVKPGWSFDGCSLSQKGNMCLLVQKATHEGTPLVAYTTGRTPTDCVRIFCRRWLQERVEWHSDKFRTI